MDLRSDPLPSIYINHNNVLLFQIFKIQTESVITGTYRPLQRNAKYSFGKRNRNKKNHEDKPSTALQRLSESM